MDIHDLKDGFPGQAPSILIKKGTFNYDVPFFYGLPRFARNDEDFVRNDEDFVRNYVGLLMTFI
jgi:hypothetical protein